MDITTSRENSSGFKIMPFIPEEESMHNMSLCQVYQVTYEEKKAYLCINTLKEKQADLIKHLKASGFITV